MLKAVVRSAMLVQLALTVAAHHPINVLGIRQAGDASANLMAELHSNYTTQILSGLPKGQCTEQTVVVRKEW